MPIHEGNVLSPDEAVARGLCPECGVNLKGLSIEDHIAGHWARFDNPEAKRRAELMRSHAKSNHSQPPEEEAK